MIIHQNKFHYSCAVLLCCPLKPGQKFISVRIVVEDIMSSVTPDANMYVTILYSSRPLFLKFDNIFF